MTAALLFLSSYLIEGITREGWGPFVDVRLLRFTAKEKKSFLSAPTENGSAASDEYPSFFENLLLKSSRPGPSHTISIKPQAPGLASRSGPTAPAGDTPADNRTTADVTDTTAVRTYKIQLGSFLSAEGAQALVKKLQAKGYRPYIETNTVSGKQTAYRVRVGSFMSMAEAQQTAAEIEKKEGSNVIITSH